MGGSHRARKGVTATFENWTGFGPGEKPQLWIVKRDPVSKGAHIALNAPDALASFKRALWNALETT